MKRLTIIALAVLSVLSISCAKEEVQETLTLQSTEITFPYAGGEQTISFDASTAWTISSDADWIHFSAESGEAGSASVTITVDKNDTYSERTASVSISFGSKTSEISIVQKELTEFTSVMQYVIGYEAQTVEISVESNIDYTAEVEEAAEDWLSVSATKAEPVAGKVSVSVKENSGITPRTGKVFITSGDAVQCIEIVQNANFETMPTASVTYLGHRMFIYDDENWEHTSFAEYAITLTSEDGTSSVVLAVNSAKSDSPLTAVPAGTYTVDMSGKHAENTFSVNADEEYCTSIVDDGNVIPVVDGEINVAVENGVYSITAVLLDETDAMYRYSYSGEIAEIADDSFGGDIYASFSGDYSTHFASKANQWSFTIYVSSAPSADLPYISYLTFNVYGEAGDVNYEDIPTGEFTFAVPQLVETGYASGNYDAKPNTFYVDYMNDIDYNSAYDTEISGGSLSISKNDDGTYNIVLTDIDVAGEEIGTFKYTAEFDNVNVDVSDGSSVIYEDVDTEFTSALSFQGMWYGAKLAETGNSFLYGSTTVNGVFTVYLYLHSTKEWEFVPMANRPTVSVVSKPPVGTYVLSDDPTSSECVLYKGSNSYVSNSYTGTKMMITGGSVTLSDATVTFDLTAEKDGGEEIHFTGTVPHTLGSLQDKR